MYAKILNFHLWAESFIFLIMIKVDGTNQCDIYTAEKEHFLYTNL